MIAWRWAHEIFVSMDTFVSKKKYRIGLLVDQPRVSAYVADLVDQANASDDIDISTLVIHAAAHTSLQGVAKFRFLARSQGLYVAVSRLFFGLVTRFEKAVFLRRDCYRAHLRSCDIAEQVPIHVHTQPIVSKSGFVYRFSEDDLNKIQSLNLDVLIRCGNGILKGGILSAARHGVLSMHHGDNRVNRGGPAAFWEVYERQPTTGFIIQRLTEELDGGDVLFRGNISTDPIYLRNQAHLYARSNRYLLQVTKDVCDGRATAEAKQLFFYPLYKTPLLHVSVRYLLKTLWFFAAKAARRAVGKRWRWSVAYCRGHWRQAVLWRARTIENPPGRFYADPFVLERDGRTFLFVEDYSYKKGKGVITALEVLPAGETVSHGVALEEGFHLSFPFVFEHQGETFMVPETSGSSQVRLYRCTAFPNEWVLHKVLLDGVNAVDTIIFDHRDKWWLLTTMNPVGIGANDSELYVFSSDRPDGHWQPSPFNPVLVDAGRGRNGGILRDRGEIYRVCQRHGFAHYGKGSSILQMHLSDDGRYSETRVQDVEPRFRRRIRSTHHLHASANYLVFDFAQLSRVWPPGSG